MNKRLFIIGVALGCFYYTGLIVYMFTNVVIKWLNGGEFNDMVIFSLFVLLLSPLSFYSIASLIKDSFSKKKQLFTT